MASAVEAGPPLSVAERILRGVTDKDSLPFVCPKCAFEASNAFTFRRHAWLSHVNKASRFESVIFSCSICCASTTNLNRLEWHLVHMHSDIPVSEARAIINWITLEHDEELDMVVEEELGACSNPSSPSMNSYKEPRAVRKPITSRLPMMSGEVNKSHDWSKLIARSEKKFTCLLCPHSLYNGRTEVVFHVVTRHITWNQIETDLSRMCYLTTETKRRIGMFFAEGMRIRSGVHYKDAERVEAALFRSVELHLRYCPPPPPPPTRAYPSGEPEESLLSASSYRKTYTCSGCGSIFKDQMVAFTHINEELRSSLPDFMSTRSCPWSLSNREEWVWCVPDTPLQLCDRKPADQQSISSPKHPQQSASKVVSDASLTDTEAILFSNYHTHTNTQQ